MSLIIEMTPELEAQLREEAAKTGTDASTFVVDAVEERLQRTSRRRMPPRLSHEESTLLQRINQGLPEAAWQEYRDLIAKRRAETLTSAEQERLIELSEIIEESHVQRIADVADLARRRHVPIELLMAQLGVKPRKV